MSRGLGRVLVQAGSGRLALKKVQLEGRRTVEMSAFLAGHPHFVGARLGRTSWARKDSIL